MTSFPPPVPEMSNSVMLPKAAGFTDKKKCWRHKSMTIADGKLKTRSDDLNDSR